MGLAALVESAFNMTTSPSNFKLIATIICTYNFEQYTK